MTCTQTHLCYCKIYIYTCMYVWMDVSCMWLTMVKKVGLENPNGEDTSLRNDGVLYSFVFSLLVRKNANFFFFFWGWGGLNNENECELVSTHFEFHGVCLICFLKSITLSLLHGGGSFFQAKSCLLACRSRAIRSSRKRSAKDIREETLCRKTIGIWNMCIYIYIYIYMQLTPSCNARCTHAN